jgi:DeoR family fructose operon transcriptional repressor
VCDLAAVTGLVTDECTSPAVEAAVREAGGVVLSA